MKKNKFSIIVPVYNVEEYISRSIDSILNQSYKDFEIIIIYDESNDNSEKVIDTYVKKNKSIKKYKSNKTGLGGARNIGIKESKGDYILFVDADDYIEKDLLKILNLEINKEDIVRFQVREVFIDEFKEYNEKPFETISGVKAFEKIVQYHFIEPSWAYCYKTSFLIENELYFSENRIAEDYGLTPLIIAKAKTVKSIDYIGYNYFQRENSLMNNNVYEKKIKKIDDMIFQSEVIKRELLSVNGSDRIVEFLNNSLIYYSTTLKYNDYRKIKKRLKSLKCFDHLKPENLRSFFRIVFIKANAYVFYRYIVRWI